MQLHVDASCVTVKADAARRSFNAYGDGIVWAVVDTGIDADAPALRRVPDARPPDVADLHRDFTGAGTATPTARSIDEVGHGTHVAGIIAGAVEPWLAENRERIVRRHREPAQPGEPAGAAARAPHRRGAASCSPVWRRGRSWSASRRCRAGGTLDDRVNRVIAALAYVREVNGEGTDGMRIHGVNLSVGYEFDPEWFACGHSPLCKEVDKLVRSGVVVVVAAGNSGYGALDVAGWERRRSSASA